MASFGAAWQGNYYCQTEIILESQSIANNTSTFLVRVWFGTAAGWWIDANFNAGAYVGGAWVAGFSSGQRYVAGGSSALFVDTRQTRTHNNDGTLTLSISGNVSTNNVVTFNQWSGGDYTFPTIPRATDPNWSGNFEAGTAKTINLPRASSSFTHDVSYSFGSIPMTSIATGAGVTTSWTPDVALLNQIPNAASGSGTLRVVTKNGGTVIGTKDKSFTLSAAPTVVPSISAVLWDDDNTTVKNNIGAFVKSASRIKGSVTAAGVYGSTITSKGLIVNGSPIPENTTISVETSGTIAASGTATDSRGRTVTQSATFNVLDYAPPKAVTFTVNRTDSTGAPKDDGQYLKLTLDASVQSLIVSSTQKNSMKIVVKTRPISSSTWTTRNTIDTGLTYTSSVLISGGGIYLASSSYVVRVEITDKVYNTVETGGYAANKTVATGTVTLDLNGSNVGIGKFHENGKLDVAGDIFTSGSISSNGNIYGGAEVGADTVFALSRVWEQSVGEPLIMPGTVLPFAGSNTYYSEYDMEGRRNWLLCDGSAVSRTTYADLFLAIGTTYGAGDGSTTFNLPDMRGRVPAGYDSTQTEFDTLGKKYGTKTHTLTGAQLPPHAHGFKAGSHSILWGQTQTNNVTFAVAATATGTSGNNLMTSQNLWNQTDNYGSGAAHNNIQPTIALNYIIKT